MNAKEGIEFMNIKINAWLNTNAFKIGVICLFAIGIYLVIIKILHQNMTKIKQNRESTKKTITDLYKLDMNIEAKLQYEKLLNIKTDLKNDIIKLNNDLNNLNLESADEQNVKTFINLFITYKEIKKQTNLLNSSIKKLQNITETTTIKHEFDESLLNQLEEVIDEGLIVLNRYAICIQKMTPGQLNIMADEFNNIILMNNQTINEYLSALLKLQNDLNSNTATLSEKSPFKYSLLQLQSLYDDRIQIMCELIVFIKNSKIIYQECALTKNIRNLENLFEKIENTTKTIYQSLSMHSDQ